MLEKERHNLILKLVDERSIVQRRRICALDLLERVRSHDPARHQCASPKRRGEAHSRWRRSGAPAPPAASGRHALRHEPGRERAARSGRSRAPRPELIVPGESIIINGGTTTFALVEFLENFDLDILTNSLPIAGQAVRDQPQPHHAAGRHASSASRTSCSALSRTTPSESLWGNKLFVGCYGAEPLRHDGSRSAHRAGADQAS